MTIRNRVIVFLLAHWQKYQECCSKERISQQTDQPVEKVSSSSVRRMLFHKRFEEVQAFLPE
jgi:predicted nucleotidyltransferase